MLEYDFMQRALAAGFLVGLICPVIGVFITMRRQAMIGDGLGHIAFAGVAGGWLFGVYPVLSATAVTALAAVAIEELRSRRPASADMILAIFFYTGIALAIVFSSMSKTNSVNLISYLFGSIVTVSAEDIKVILALALIVLGCLTVLYKEILYITFDEEAARVSGLPVKKINMLLAVLTAMTISVSMRIVGILLVSALIVVPVAASVHISKSFRATLINSLIFSEIAVIAGLTFSYYLNIASGGTIVLTAVIIFMGSYFTRQFAGQRTAKAIDAPAADKTCAPPQGTK